MEKNLGFLAKTTLSASIYILATAGHAEMTLEQQVAQLQQQVQALQTLVQQQKVANEQIVAEIPALKEKSTERNSLLKHETKGGAEFELYGNVRADMSYQMKGPSTMYNLISGVSLEGS